MCKKLLQELLKLKSTLKTTLAIVPKERLSRISKDIDNLFNGCDNLKTEELLEIKRLANSKLKALNRIYGEDKKEEDQNILKSRIQDNINSSQNNEKSTSNINYNDVEFDENTKERYVKNQEGEKIDIKSDDFVNNFIHKRDKYQLSKSDLELLNALNNQAEIENSDKKFNYDYIKKMEAFNKDKNNSFYEIFDKKISEINDSIFEEGMESLKKQIENLRKEGKEEQILKEFDNFNWNNSRWIKKNNDGKVEVDENLIKKDAVAIYNTFFEKGGEEYFKNFDFKSLNSSKKKGGIVYEGSTASEFMLPNQNEADSENQINNSSKYLELGRFGNFKVVEENISNLNNEQEQSKSGKEDLKLFDNKLEESNLDSSTREKFIWKNGKLVPGEGKKREISTILNWNASNLDPKDVKKHRELIDRQHFGGPLWEGIKRKSLMDEPVKLTQEDLENSISKEEWDAYVSKNKGEKSVEEIVR